jgi:hypothetical protein
MPRGGHLLSTELSPEALAKAGLLLDGGFISLRNDQELLGRFSLGFGFEGEEIAGRCSPGSLACCDECGKDYPMRGIQLTRRKKPDKFGIYVPGFPKETRCPDCGSLLYPWLSHVVKRTPKWMLVIQRGGVYMLSQHPFGKCSVCGNMGILNGRIDTIIHLCIDCIMVTRLPERTRSVIYELNFSLDDDARLLREKMKLLKSKGKQWGEDESR